MFLHEWYGYILIYLELSTLTPESWPESTAKPLFPHKQQDS
jgi:hypothetical protein